MPVIYEIKQGEESLSSHSGLALIGILLSKTDLRDRLERCKVSGSINPDISNSDIVSSLIGLLCIGKPNYDAIEPFRQIPFFCQSLDLERCPSSATIRQRIDIIGNTFDAIIKEESAKLVKMMAETISPVETSCGEFVPLDIDVSAFDNSKTQKEGVSRTYKGFDGYAPIFAYIGQEGYLVNNELRIGKQHCQKDTPQFIKQTIDLAKTMTDSRILLRLDSGNDSKDNFPYCLEQGLDFIIKRNLRKEQPTDWLELAKKNASDVIQFRKGKKVWYGKTDKSLSGSELEIPIFYQVTERTIKKGQSLLVPEVDVDTYWSTLDCDAKEIVCLYHDHGTSEQFHSELKTDMDLERLPSGKFSSNAFILTLSILAYNILRLCGQQSLNQDNSYVKKIPRYKKNVQRRRIRTVILDLIYMAVKIVHTARKWILSFGKINPLARLWSNVYKSFVFA